MQVLISHLTRMAAPHICVAGLDLETNRHIRPVCGRIENNQLRRHGGMFDIGSIVELNPGKSVGSPPETEDHSYELVRSRWTQEVDHETFWNRIDETSCETLTDIFGTELVPIRSGYAVNEGTGTASLGHLKPENKPVIYVNSWGKIRLSLQIDNHNADISVTDLRLYQDDLVTPRRDVIAEISRRINDCEVILSVGLARAFQVSWDTQRRHWLQINNIHLEDNPVWTEYGLE